MMNGNENLSSGLLTENGLSDEALAELRKQQARSLVLSEKRKAGRIRAICIGAWALTLIVMFAAMAMSTLFLLGTSGSQIPRLMAMSASMLAMFGVLAFLIAVVSSVAWYFSARTASLAAIDARLGQLEAILKAEADRAHRDGGQAAREQEGKGPGPGASAGEDQR
jgi:hypothetical protein